MGSSLMSSKKSTKMNRGLLVATLLLVYLGLSSGSCSSPNEEDHEKALFRSRIMRRMDMTEEQIRSVNMTAVEEARSFLPTLEHHMHHEDLETLFLLEHDSSHLANGDHLFIIPEMISSRRLSAAFLTFKIIQTEFTHPLIVEVIAYDVKSETMESIAMKSFSNLRKGKEQKMDLDRETVMGWLESDLDSIVLSIAVRPFDSNQVIAKDDAESMNVKIGLNVVSRSKRIRRSIRPDNRCKAGEKDQGCCVELGMPHIISPTTLGLSYCNGHCNLDASFPALFSQLTRRVFDTGRFAGETCCHGVEFEHLEIIYLNDKREIRSELIYDIIATECACN